MQRRTGIVLAIAVAGLLVFAGWRSVFVGGWHVSGDGSYECPHSPWHTIRHPLPPNAFGEMFRGIPEACNRDAERVATGWAIAEFVTVGATAVILRMLISSRPTDTEA